MTPRWTYTEANASRWRPLFDDLLAGAPPIEIPLEGNAKSLCSLKVRICDALKWLADGFHKHHNPSMKPYARLKPQMRYEAQGDSLIVELRKHPILYRELPCPLHLGQAKLNLTATRYLGRFPQSNPGHPSKIPKQRCLQRFSPVTPEKTKLRSSS